MKRMMATSTLLAAAVLFSGCSEKHPDAKCGGRVRFHQSNPAEADAILQAARRDSKDYCVESGGACDFSVTKKDDGWIVVALAVNTREGRCLYRIGYDRYYIYDKSGRLLRTLQGI